eukprot:5351509-Pyramimonas_sp.AAC.1
MATLKYSAHVHEEAGHLWHIINETLVNIDNISVAWTLVCPITWGWFITRTASPQRDPSGVSDQQGRPTLTVGKYKVHTLLRTCASARAQHIKPLLRHSTTGEFSSQFSPETVTDADNVSELGVVRFGPGGGQEGVRFDRSLVDIEHTLIQGTPISSAEGRDVPARHAKACHLSSASIRGGVPCEEAATENSEERERRAEAAR